MYTLPKSDFKVAMTCSTKLYYRKLKYPTTMEGNEFMEMLAEGGYTGVNLFKRENGLVVSPYYLLPAAKEIDEYEVKEGTGAMRAYQDMLYGFAKNDPIKKESIKNALLTYCKLDTLAMVIIYEHWMSI
jgi:hypothetical protein